MAAMPCKRRRRGDQQIAVSCSALASPDYNYQAALQSIWTTNESLCDCILRVTSTSGNTEEIRAHRLVLATASSKWRAELTGGWSLPQVSQLAVLTLSDSEPAAVRQLLQMLYTGKAQLRDMNELIEAAKIAHYLNLTGCKDVLVAEAASRITIKSCVQILLNAQLAGLEQLERQALLHILRNFEAVSETEQFTQLPPELLLQLLVSPGLHVNCEEAVLESVVGWVKGNAEDKGYVEELLDQVRFVHIRSEYLVLQAPKLLPESAALRERCLEAVAFNSLDQGHNTMERRVLANVSLVPRTRLCSCCVPVWKHELEAWEVDPIPGMLLRVDAESQALVVTMPGPADTFWRHAWITFSIQESHSAISAPAWTHVNGRQCDSCMLEPIIGPCFSKVDEDYCYDCYMKLDDEKKAELTRYTRPPTIKSIPPLLHMNCFPGGTISMPEMSDNTNCGLWDMKWTLKDVLIMVHKWIAEGQNPEDPSQEPAYRLFRRSSQHLAAAEQQKHLESLNQSVQISQMQHLLGPPEDAASKIQETIAGSQSLKSLKLLSQGMVD